MKLALTTLAALVLIVPSAGAQRITSFGAELRPFVAAYVPMGVLRDDLRDGATVGGQAALQLSDYWHMVATIGVTFGKSRLSSLPKDEMSIIHYDVGAEANLLYELQGDWLLKPFGGLGFGARTYDYGAAAVASRSCMTGYAAMGTELQRNVLALRVEARQYVACFQSPITEPRKTRADGLFGLGIAYHIR